MHSVSGWSKFVIFEGASPSASLGRGVGQCVVESSARHQHSEGSCNDFPIVAETSLYRRFAENLVSGFFVFRNEAIFGRYVFPGCGSPVICCGFPGSHRFRFGFGRGVFPAKKWGGVLLSFLAGETVRAVRSDDLDLMMTICVVYDETVRVVLVGLMMTTWCGGDWDSFDVDMRVQTWHSGKST